MRAGQNKKYDITKDFRFCAGLAPTKGQTKSKRFFQADVSSKKRTNEFYFTTMKPQVDLFSFGFFGGN